MARLYGWSKGLAALMGIAGLGLLVWVQAADIEYTPSSHTVVEKTPLDETERTRAQLWGLSQEEWLRYKTLLQGIRGAVSISTISPIEVLGIHARDEAERRRYAERLAQLMHDDAARVLAFNRAYFEAFQRFYGNEPLFDPAQLAALRGRPPIKALQGGDRLLLFAGLDCASCEAVAARLVEVAGREVNVGLDIYLVGTMADPAGDAAIRTWAQRLNIPRELVTQRRVTLNHDAGALARFGKGVQDVPYLVQRRGTQTTPVTLPELGL